MIEMNETRLTMLKFVPSEKFFAPKGRLLETTISAKKLLICLKKTVDIVLYSIVAYLFQKVYYMEQLV